MPVLQHWQSSDSVLPIVQCLQRGNCVVLPTESSYELVASALRTEAVVPFQRWGTVDNPVTLFIPDTASLPDWMPYLHGRGRRLFRKASPGSLILRCNGGYEYGLWSRLPTLVQSLLIQQKLLAARCPAHPLWRSLHRLSIPLMSVALPAVHTAAEIMSKLGSETDLCVDAGPRSELSTVVQFDGKKLQIQREGALKSAQLREMAQCRILFICTGNTCRSPMAESLCAKLLADHLGCSVEELNQHGFSVQSAGLAARMGQEASPEGVSVVAEYGADLSAHRSRMVTVEMLAQADYIFTMTSSHWQALRQVPGIGQGEPGLMRLLSPQEEDVADPIGCEKSEYHVCAKQILACLQQHLPELLES